MDNGKGQIVKTDLRDVALLLKTVDLITFNDDEMIIIKDLRELADLTARKITFNIVATCLSGRISLDVVGVNTTICSGQIFICHSNVMLSNFMFSPDFEGHVMCISDRLQRSILQAQAIIWNKWLYSQHAFILNINSGHFAICKELRYYRFNERSPFRHEIIASLLRVFYLELCEILMTGDVDTQSVMDRENMSRMNILFHRFLDSISRRHIKKVSVAEYADGLCISPKYLSTICRAVSGKSPTEWISEYVVEDIVQYLRNTDLSAKEIGDELGFPNASFFSKYVREHLGMSPNEYRRRLLEVKCDDDGKEE